MTRVNEMNWCEAYLIINVTTWASGHQTWAWPQALGRGLGRWSKAKARCFWLILASDQQFVDRDVRNWSSSLAPQASSATWALKFVALGFKLFTLKLKTLTLRLGFCCKTQNHMNTKGNKNIASVLAPASSSVEPCMGCPVLGLCWVLTWPVSSPSGRRPLWALRGRRGGGGERGGLLLASWDLAFWTTTVFCVSEQSTLSSSSKCPP